MNPNPIKALVADARADLFGMSKGELKRMRKAVRKAITGGDKQAAQQVFISSQRTIDSIADKKIIHKNKAARHKSRLNDRIKALKAA